MFLTVLLFYDLSFDFIFAGTYVNGIRIPEQSYVKLEHGDQIRFGYHKQAFEMQLSRGNDEVDTTRSSTAAAPEAGMAATPLEDDDSLNESDTLVISNNSAIRGHPIAQQQNQNTLLQQQRQVTATPDYFQCLYYNSY